MDKHQKILIELTAAQLFKTGYQAPADADWDKIFTEAQQQAVLLLAYEASAMQNIAEVWQLRAMKSFQSNVTVFHQHREIHELMQHKGIPYVVLKGCSSAFYYPNPLLRAMGDVDIMVDEENITRADEALSKAGFVRIDKKHDFHVAYHRGKMSVEVHTAITRFDNILTQDVVKAYCGDFISASKTVTIPDIGATELVLPSRFHHGLSITLHTIRHLTERSGVGLRHLCDLAVFYNSFENKEFSEVFEERFKAAGLWRFTQQMGLVCHKYLHIPYKPWMGSSEDKWAAAIIDDILNGGNFGIKSAADRTAQSLAINVHRGKEVKGKLARIQNFLRRCNNLGLRAFPSMDRPILRSLAWIPLGVRYLFRCMTGKRKMFGLNSLISDSEERENIYHQFHLYEAEL